jgi:uncharacterized protein (TIGR03086 family)
VAYLERMELTNALNSGTHHFLHVLDKVGADDLSRPTPCEGWSVADLLTHVARGSDMAVALVLGATTEEASAFFQQEAPADPVDACRESLDAQLVALHDENDRDKIVHHPMGDIPVSQLMNFRIGDLTLHAWDLARAIGADEELPVPLVEQVYRVLQPLETVIGQIGVFGEGPSGEVGADASTQVKLLDLTGRRP